MINSNWQKQDEHRSPTLKKRNQKSIHLMNVSSKFNGTIVIFQSHYYLGNKKLYIIHLWVRGRAKAHTHNE